ncbi:gas vesicle protein [Streptomyces sp. WMMC940]|uniref:gas vesicle protein n=1 Tax=Streptomyces sp. WMMC940 TaxID=3015153 RepID=UPI0022B63393|nr:gas vesicle protein [Streptomyces sp. WMMC940]MCZ7456544.1 gas vesicle protein [Streptomyces sp. WMMC940]
MGSYPSRAAPYGQSSTANLADILERVLDKGIVIAGDIQINLLDIELLTIKLRLLVASVDKAKEMGIDWWEHDPALSSRARGGERSLAEENRRLRAEVEALRRGEPLPEGGRRSVAGERSAPAEEAEEEPAEAELVEEEPPRRSRPARRPRKARDE